MSKAILTFGYVDYVLDLKDAVTLAEVLGKAERYENKYMPGNTPNTHHIYPNEEKELSTIKLISDDFYRMCKLAGKPAKD